MNFLVKYKNELIGEVSNGKYIPRPEAKNMNIFNFLKEEIEDINKVNFFTSRIRNCSRFESKTFEYSTDDYSFEMKGEPV